MLKIGKYGGEQHCSFALNEFYLTTSEFLRTFRYDLIDGQYIVENLRSSGLLISSGTGSTAYLLSASKISKSRIQRLIGNLGLDITDENLVNSISKKMNSMNCFDPQSRELYFMHREILDSAKTIKPIRVEGWDKEIRFVNRDLKATSYMDSLPMEGGLEYGTEYCVRVAEEKNSLSC